MKTLSFCRSVCLSLSTSPRGTMKNEHSSSFPWNIVLHWLQFMFMMSKHLALQPQASPNSSTSLSYYTAMHKKDTSQSSLANVLLWFCVQGHYMLVEGAKGTAEAAAILKSPILGATSSICQLSFWLHMTGPDAGKYNYIFRVHSFIIRFIMP